MFKLSNVLLFIIIVLFFTGCNTPYNESTKSSNPELNPEELKINDQVESEYRLLDVECKEFVSKSWSSSGVYSVLNDTYGDNVHVFKDGKLLYSKDTFMLEEKNKYFYVKISPSGKEFIATKFLYNEEKTQIILVDTETGEEEIFFEYDEPLFLIKWTDRGIYLQKRTQWYEMDYHVDKSVYLLSDDRNMSKVEGLEDKAFKIVDIYKEWVLYEDIVNNKRYIKKYNLKTREAITLNEFVEFDEEGNYCSYGELAFLNSSDIIIGHKYTNAKGYQVITSIEGEIKILCEGQFIGLLSNSFVYKKSCDTGYMYVKSLYMPNNNI
ncbi:hypothetical protein F8154_03635 [Alkaliphilus pronyensis]|uniref:WG repeat-containing protein n=1 Tax=Alkaliphilus pronyensis TaxID=1482732 RepID=A0A6I0FAI5_9FIRM|nr:hypothetical protein [Alkaliphilus pronyensis]KAB3537392.1 hypothetical protein F8154_03635 [Alkaliphilus pronyensis]